MCGMSTPARPPSHPPQSWPHSDRLRLRPLRAADVPALHALHNDPEVMRYLTGGAPVSVEHVRTVELPRLTRWFDAADGPGFWGAERRDGKGGLLGWFELRPLDANSAEVFELGYRLRREVWGRRYASEGGRLLVRRAFERLGARRVTANTMAVNTASRRVMERCGLRYLRSYAEDWPDPLPGSEHGEVEYVVDLAEWEADVRG
ncbi:GNAT family N-acetyltransferase [Streptomyces bohaiensis]|uniref:GNAT family N-acetyltransferase n=2 Tax=Streptomyces bohaiensis TaxID=1431344 RepID=A0ABX1CG33_9ACTN|nr:GNAT family N-acetyltransferase [Streptomyces bohaiensis]